MTDLVLPGVNRPFVAALQQIAETTGTWSVIGGFAVWMHLGIDHRPTLDVDTAAAANARATLVTLGLPGNSDHRRIVEGVKLEIIEVEDPGPEAADLEPKHRLFVTAHWAAATATITREVRSQDLTVIVPVARRLPLIACKLHAWLDRRDQRTEKRGSDGLDIIELLRTADWGELASDAHLSDPLRTALEWAADTVLVQQAVRVTRLIQLHTNAVPPAASEVRALAQLLLERL